MKEYEKGHKTYHRHPDKNRPQKSILPFAIFLAILFLAAYLFFSNYYFA